MNNAKEFSLHYSDKDVKQNFVDMAFIPAIE